MYYIAKNPDVRAAGVDPVGHYLDYGARERRDPNPFFSSILYLVENPEVAEIGANPLVHYTLVGAAQGRSGVHRR